MRALSLGFAVLGLGFALSGCVYYPDGPDAAYGPDWCNYHPRRCAAMYGPMARRRPAMPNRRRVMPVRPRGIRDRRRQAIRLRSNRLHRKVRIRLGAAAGATRQVNDPTWCNSHPRKCEALRERFGMARPGNDPEPQQGYGPPPANGAPTPLNNNGSQGSPPGQ